MCQQQSEIPLMTKEEPFKICLIHGSRQGEQAKLGLAIGRTLHKESGVQG